MKAHEIEVKNKNGKTLTVSVEYYEANSAELKPTMDAKEIKAYCEAHHKARSEAVEKMQAEAKKKMEKEVLKNKGR